MKKIIAINAGPRKGWNTDLMIKEAARGAADNGARIVEYDLYRLEKFTGCVSCFGCKREATYGKCIVNDGLAPVLEDIRTADGVIIGSPNYLGDVTAVCRRLYERLIFQHLTYNKEEFSYNEHRTPVLFIMTSNAGRAMYEQDAPYGKLLAGYKANFENFVGPCKVVVAANTLQVDDYSQYKWTMFDPKAKHASRQENFPSDLAAAYAAGRDMAKD